MNIRNMTSVSARTYVPGTPSLQHATPPNGALVQRVAKRSNSLTKETCDHFRLTNGTRKILVASAELTTLEAKAPDLNKTAGK